MNDRKADGTNETTAKREVICLVCGRRQGGALPTRFVYGCDDCERPRAA